MKKCFYTILLILLTYGWFSIIFNCSSKKTSEEERKDWVIECLPPRSYDIKHIGNGWAYFSLDGKNYLFHARVYGNRESVTQIKE